jgi:predicted NUDIX family phosphoesterase
LVRDYKIRKAIKSSDILKKESAKVKGYYNKAARRVITFFKQLVYYDHNKVKFGEFEHIRERADEID